jgi:hypothetical protein
MQAQIYKTILFVWKPMEIELFFFFHHNFSMSRVEI